MPGARHSCMPDNRVHADPVRGQWRRFRQRRAVADVHPRGRPAAHRPGRLRQYAELAAPRPTSIRRRGRGGHPLHRDHFGGLPYLILDGQFSRRTRRSGDRPARHRRPAHGRDGRCSFRGRAPWSGASRSWWTRSSRGVPVDLGGVPGQCVGGCTRERSTRGGRIAVEALYLDRPIRYHLDYRTVRAHLNNTQLNQ